MSPATLFRLSGWAAVASGLCLLIDTLFVELFLPVNALTVSIGHFAVIMGFFAILGIYLWQREASGRLGGVAFIVNFLGLAYLAGVMFFVNYVAPYLSPEARQQVLASPARAAFLGSALLFEAGVILFGVATARAGRFPRLAAALYVIGYTAFVVEAFVPAAGPLDAVIRALQAAGGLAVLWMGSSLVSQQRALPRAAAAGAAGA